MLVGACGDKNRDGMGPFIAILCIFFANIVGSVGKKTIKFFFPFRGEGILIEPLHHSLPHC